MRISDWSSDVCSSDLLRPGVCKDNSWRGRKSAIFRHRNQSRGAHGQSPCASRSYEHSLSGHDQTLVRWRRGFEPTHRSEEHTSELQSLMRISYAVFCLKTKTTTKTKTIPT